MWTTSDEMKLIVGLGTYHSNYAPVDPKSPYAVQIEQAEKNLSRRISVLKKYIDCFHLRVDWGGMSKDVKVILAAANLHLKALMGLTTEEYIPYEASLIAKEKEAAKLRRDRKDGTVL